MNILKTTGLIIVSSLAGFFASLYVVKTCNLMASENLEKKISEYKTIKAQINADNHFFDNIEAFDNIEILQYAEKSANQEIIDFLIPKLAKRYQLAIEWSESEHETDAYKKANQELIKRLDELSKQSDIFKEITKSVDLEDNQKQ